MKKTKILAGAVALSLMLSSASVFAETKMWNMPENTEGAEYYDAAPADMYNRNDDISVVFNGEIIAFNELYPVNIDGRVKLPFRELLENIGATVDYDESTGTVSAVRNNTEIKFALNSNTIYVNDNGNTSEFVMDSSIDIINDRTFVPVRFMAEAFGLTVGWDDSFKTVVITDIDSYIKRIADKCGNYMKVGELGYALNENYSSNQKLRLVFDMENAFSETPQISNLQAELVSSTAKDKEIIESNNTLSISSFNLIEPGKSFDLKDVTFNIILKGKKLYISTNLVEVMKSVKPDDKTLAIAAEIINENTWLEGDIDELLVDFCGMDEKSAELFTAMLTEPQSFDKALSASFAGFDENSAISAVMMESQIDSIIRLFGDDLFKLNQNADGSYNFSYSLTKDKLIDYITEAAAASGEIGIEDMLEAEEIFEAFNINITINGNISDEKINNDMSLEISVNTDAFKLNAAWAAQSDSEIGTVDFTDYAFPENTRNLNTILTLLKTRLY